MNRFLVSYLYTPESDEKMSVQIFKLTHAHTYDPKTIRLAENAIAFVFVSGDFETAEELQSTFVRIGIGNLIYFKSDSNKLKQESPIYCIGQELRDANGINWIVNDRAQSKIASHFLGNNYMVITL